MAIRREQRGLEHAVETGQRNPSVVGHDGFIEDAPDRIAHGFIAAETGEFASAFAQEAGVAGRLPDVLAKQILQLRLPHAINQRRRRPHEFAFHLEKRALEARHVLDRRQASAGGGSAGRGGDGGRGYHGRGQNSFSFLFLFLLWCGG